MSAVVIERNITLAEVRAARPTMIWYGAMSCWWTHDPDDLKEATQLAKSPERKGGWGPLPTDPRGGVLMEAHDPGKFLRLAEENVSHYGKHGLAAFMAAHHKNCRIIKAGFARPWCLASWQEYNEALGRIA